MGGHVSAHVIRGDARRLPLPDASVDLIVTSPPYWQLRSYQDGGEHYDGQIGDEATPRAYVEALLEATAEWVRVLKPSGSLWVNLGDKYANRSGTGWGREGTTTSRGKAEQVRHATGYSRADTARASGLPEKSLMNLPARYAIACTDELGLILRAEVVWSKPNGLPESVTDRVRRSHELWLHFTRCPRYYSALDVIREPTATADPADPSYRANGKSNGRVKGLATPPGMRPPGLADAPREASNPLGRLPGSVWEVPTEPLIVPKVSPLDGRPLPDHFAAFPTEFPLRIIAGFSPLGVCVACGQGRRPIVDAQRTIDGEPAQLGAWKRGRGEVAGIGNWRFGTRRLVVGCACGCDQATAPTTPAVVLDPFGGTGTVALCADVLGRTGISVDLSHDYGRLARWRTTDPGERARAMRVDKPPAQAEGQEALFAMEG